MKKLIKYMTTALVDHPEKIKVFEVNGGQTLIFELKVAKEDIGKVIGNKGQTVNAMRTILIAASHKAQKKVFLEIIE